jgi:hypothetical protein
VPWTCQTLGQLHFKYIVLFKAPYLIVLTITYCLLIFSDAYYDHRLNDECIFARIPASLPRKLVT